MLNTYGDFLYALCTFQGVIVHQQHKNQNVGSPRSKHRKPSTQIQTNRNGKPNPTPWTTIKCNTIRGLSVFFFSALGFLQIQQISVKHCLINFMSYKSDNWAGEYDIWPPKRSIYPVRISLLSSKLVLSRTFLCSIQHR